MGAFSRGAGRSSEQTSGGGAFSRGSSGADEAADAPKGVSQTQQLAYAIARLRVSDPKKAKQYEHMVSSIPEAERKKAGLEAPKKGGGGILGGVKNATLGAVGKVFEVLDRPSQAVLDITEGLRKNEGFSETLGEVGQALQGKGDRNNLRTAYGMDKDAGGFAGDVLDFAGTVITDPLTYLGAGSGAAARTGTKAIGKVAGKEAAEAIAKKGGRRALKELDEKAVREGLEKLAAEANLKKPAKVAARQIKAVKQRGAGGLVVRIPGTDIGGSIIKGRTIRAGAEKARLVDKVAPVARTGAQANDAINEAARAYSEARGLKPVDVNPKLVVDDNFARRVADAYDALPVDDSLNPAVIKSYEALKKETVEQFDYLTKDLGVKVEFVDHDPYRSASELYADLMQNKRLKVYKTAPDQSHPFFSPAENDMFRAVHDAFGHAASGNEFSRHGEEIAFRKHAGMFSPDAIPAMATETRGQNAWLNFSRTNAELRAKGVTDLPNGGFPVQKVGLLPEEFYADVLGKGDAVGFASGRAAEAAEKLAKHQEKIANQQAKIDDLSTPKPGETPLQRFTREAKRDDAVRRLDELTAETAELDSAVQATSEAVRSAERTASSAQPVVEQKVVKPGLGGAVSRTGLGTTLARTFKNRADLARSAGGDAAEEFYRATVRAESRAALKGTEVVDRIRRALDASGVTEEELNGVVREALDAPRGTVASTAAQLRRDGRAGVADLLLELDAIRKETNARLLKSGIADADTLRDPEEYLLHKVTDKGAKALGKAAPSKRAAAGMRDNDLAGALGLRGSLKERTFLGADASITDKNLVGKTQFGTDKLFETNAAKLVAEAAERAARGEEALGLVDELSTISNGAGEPLVLSAVKGADDHASVVARARDLGYELVDETAGGRDIWAPAEVADQLKRARAIVLNDDALKDYARRYDKALQVWKAYKTLPIIGGVSFFSRNFQSNYFLNVIENARYGDPRLYTQAMRYQRKLGKLASITPEAMKAAGLSDREAKTLMAAFEEGVIGRGFFATDLDELGKNLGARDLKGKAGRALNPVSSDNALLRSGKKINSAIENNARLAHFLGALEVHGDVAEAAASVRRTLFDYGDLTAVEQKVLKRVLPFYTFMRKNTALMAGKLVEQPGKASAISHFQDRVLGSTDPLPGDALTPGYATERGQNPLNSAITKALTGGKAPVVGRLDDPVSSAIDTVGPAIKAVALLTGKEELAPDGAAGVARELADMPGGPVADLAKLLVETGTGTDLFTGAPAKTDKGAVVQALVEAFGPSVSKGKNLGAAKETLLGDATPKERARFINAFVGAAITVVDDAATKSAQTRARFELEEVIADLKAKGRKVPTITELRDAGIVPATDGARNARSPRRSGGSSGAGGAFSRR